MTRLADRRSVRPGDVCERSRNRFESGPRGPGHAKARREVGGSDGLRNGVGSARRVKVGPMPAFEESVTEFRPDELIRYRMSRDSLVGSVVTDHEGSCGSRPRPAAARACST